MQKKVYIISAGVFLFGLLISAMRGESFRNSADESIEDTSIKMEGLSMRSDQDSKSYLSAKSSNFERFEMASFLETLLKYDETAERDVELEALLKIAIFRADRSELMKVRDALAETESPDRFQSFTAVIYARWAELDPEEAWRESQAEEQFPKEALKGVLLTWLSMDSDSATAVLLAEKKSGHLEIMKEHCAILAQHDPEKAAAFVDSLFENWPEADAALFSQVARDWAERDSEAAAKWVASYWDRDKRNDLLKTLATDTGRSGGRRGLRIAELIDDPDLKKAARLEAISLWGITATNRSLGENVEDLDLSLVEGFPNDWSETEIQSFSKGAMNNRADLYPDLVASAQNDSQLESVHIGALEGALLSEPGKVAGAAEGVSVEYANSDAGKEMLTKFFERWHEQSPDELREWASDQSAGPKQVMAQEVIDSNQ